MTNKNNFTLDDIETIFEQKGGSQNQNYNNSNSNLNIDPEGENNSNLNAGPANADPASEPATSPANANDQEILNPVNIPKKNSNSNSNSNSDLNIDPEDFNNNNLNLKDEEPEITEEKQDNLLKSSENKFEDFIIDDESFIIESVSDSLEIEEEEIIPESKIIANEKDQLDDFINEYMKLIPDELKENRFVKRKTNNLIKQFVYLKNIHSVFSDDINKTKFKLNSNHSLLEQLINGDLNNYFIPIVTEKKNLYKIHSDYSEILESENIDEIESDSVNILDNADIINQTIDLREKYKKSASRINYSYNNELNELYSLMDSYTNKENINSYNYKIQNDIEVLNNECLLLNNNKFENKIIIHKYLGDTTYIDKYVESDDINIKGFLRFPKQVMKINELNELKLLDVVNSDYTKLDLYNNLNTNVNEFVDNKLKKNSNVVVYFSNKQTINGTIIENTKEHYKIKHLESEKITTLNKNEKNYQILNIQYNERNNLIDDENIFKSYLFSEDVKINSINKVKKIFKQITPSNNLILSKINDTLDNEDDINTILEYMRYYKLNLDNVNFEDFENIIKNLQNNNDKIIKDSKIKESKFIGFLKTPVSKKINNDKFISNKKLKEFEKYYGIYPYYKSSTDCLSTRLSWVNSRPDNGNLFFYTIIKEIQSKINTNPELVISNIESKLSKLETKKISLEESIDIEKESIISSKNPCIERFIAKNYISVEDLENDNGKEIFIDEDKQKYGLPKNVQLGHYALLDKNGSKQLYKRITIASGKQIWNLQESIKLDNLIQTNKDFCEQQDKTLNSLNDLIKLGKNQCRYEDLSKECLPLSMYNKLVDLIKLNNEINLKNQDLQQLKLFLYDTENNLDSMIKYYTNFISLTNNLEKKKYLYKEEESKVIKEDINPKYENLYLKIDLYLEKIGKLEEKDKYMLLDSLIKKYGRNATSEKENEKNIYCIYGSKKICCKHHKYLIDIHQKNSDYDDSLDTLLKNYGIENNGIYWCNNCGEEIIRSDDEAIGGFTTSGAREILHEVIEDEVYESKYENSELLESLKKYLDEESVSVKNPSELDSINIIKIVNVILKIMGIKLNDSDEVNVIKYSDVACKSYIKNKTSWLKTYKGKKSKIDKSYQNYLNINTILYSVCYLFIFLQISIPEYVINRPHSKCKVSLNGYPLNEDNEDGIVYLSCILDSLKNGSELYSCLKKLKIKETIKSTLSKIIKEDFIAQSYENKINYLAELKLNEKIMPLANVWYSFKPPLFSYDINNEDYNLKTINNTLTNNEDINNYYSLKVISEIDAKINASKVESNLFVPIILEHSCCLAKIDDYNYMNFFDKGLLKFKEKGKNIEKIFNKNKYVSKVNVTHNDYSSYESFSTIMMPLEKDINQKTIDNLFSNYIYDGIFQGHKYLFYKNICILSGINKQDLLKTKFTKKDYYLLLKKIQNRKLIYTNYSKSSIHIFENMKTKISNNKIIRNNKYLKTFIENLDKAPNMTAINDLWGDFIQQLNSEIAELTSFFEKKLPVTKTKTINKILNNFSNLNNIRNEQDSLYSKATSEYNYFNEKVALSNKYMKLIEQLINKIKNNNTLSEIILPKNWKLEKSYKELLLKNVAKEHTFINKYITEKNTNNYDLLYYKLSKILENSITNLNICSEEHVYNCEDNSMLKISKLTNKNVGLIYHYIFIILIKTLLNYHLYEKKTIKSMSNENIESHELDLELINEFDQFDISVEEKSDELYTNEQLVVCNLLYDILVNIEENRVYLDSFTQKKIDKTIEKKLESEKESNLKFIEELDKETRQSLKSMISIGLDSWKNLFRKDDKALYFDSSEYDLEGDNDIDIDEEYSEEDMRNKANDILGEGYSDEQYNEWLETQQENDRIDHEALQESRMQDDDGDIDYDDDYDLYY